MVGSIIIGGITTVLGYLYPAYECYKCVEQKRPDGQYLRFWCQYWMIIALITVLERLGGAFIPFIPMYLEAKLAFFVYLWYPKTRGTTYIYYTFVRPFFAGHEEEIDETLNEFQTRAGHLAVSYWQRTSAYVQSHFLELLQHLSSQTPKPPNAPPAVLPPGFQVQNNSRGPSRSNSTYNG
ncbi:unnamed protein product [Calypogeia fissa]